MIELAAVIRDLRTELEAAVAAADGTGLRFELGQVELEVSVAVERSATAGTKVRFLVVDASGEGKAGSTGTQRIKLSLTPTLEPGGGTPYVSGLAEPDER
ncbi:trypco2 family protein [Catenulispora rubra]|uniref:trypco2 family protein n=1 Tax=Catenulispora rubra TaxID=280293 RepID=UPI001892015E|nr:trypco2 family protein [Catenulispora rubra]